MADSRIIDPADDRLVVGTTFNWYDILITDVLPTEIFPGHINGHKVPFRFRSPFCGVEVLAERTKGCRVSMSALLGAVVKAKKASPAFKEWWSSERPAAREAMDVHNIFLPSHVYKVIRRMQTG